VTGRAAASDSDRPTTDGAVGEDGLAPESSPSAEATQGATHGATAAEDKPADEDEPADEDTLVNKTTEEKPPRSLWRELPILVIVALVLAYLIKTFLVQAFYIPSESMENTLLVGDRVLVNKLAYRVGEIERGDVVVFDGRGTFEPNRSAAEDDRGPVTRFLSTVASSFGLGPGSESDYIKRVIGVGGDHVVCCDDAGNLTVNGDSLVQEDYLFPGDVASSTPFDITVPADRVWLMGDHRSRSEDSRAHIGRPGGGTVSEDRVIGRAFVKVWPLNRIDLLTRPEAFSSIGDAAP
jgi:signal peptidase I